MKPSNDTPETMDAEKARELGYAPLTKGYAMPAEQWMLDGVIADMARSRIDVVLVEEWEGPSVWRRSFTE